MTREDKELLLKDLCARLPYKVKCNVYKRIGTLVGVNDYGAEIDYGNSEDTTCEIKYCKPYLRSMSSMTEEETVEYCDLQDKFLLSSLYPVTDGHALFDWLDKKMFDYRGLIPKDLAIEVTEENNPYKD